jgi:hypothetical protein
MVIANIYQNPIWHNIPWLDNNNIDFPKIISKLKQILEKIIESVKETNLEEYLYLRDLYRREKVYLNLIKIPQQPSIFYSIMINNLLISPAGCEHLDYDYFKFKAVIHHKKLWQTLYTNWGLAIAACLEGDIERGIKIKPIKNIKSELERYAQSWVCYYEGYYYLQNNNGWRKSKPLLQEAKNLISVNSEWKQQLDNIFEKKRHEINDLSEHLELAQLWYDLLNSQKSKSYLAEMKVEQVRKQILDKKISIKEALTQLRQIKNIDHSNPVVIDMIETTELFVEIEEIEKMMKANNFDGAVNRAKRSSNPKVKRMVADFCLEILVNGARSNSLHPHLVRQLVNWAYELCPNDPEIRQIRSHLGIYY